MKYIFIVQGEGRGHLTQAISLSKLLRSEGHEVVEVLVGRCSNREIPQFFTQKIGAPVVKFDSPSIDYGGGGKGGNMFRTVCKAIAPSKVRMWLKSIKTIAHHINSSEADVVVNFYELLMGATTLFHKIKPPIITIAHQFIVDHPGYHSLSSSDSGQRMLRLNNKFCSRGSAKRLLLSFYDLPASERGNIWSVPPLLRSEIFDLNSTNGDYILGYMLNPSYLDEVVEWHRSAKNPCDVHLFWDKPQEQEIVEHVEGVWLHRLNDVDFLNYMAGCRGYITTAGFESVCEAIYLGKPALMIPSHFEQSINANDAMSVGAGLRSESYDIAKLVELIPLYRANTAEFQRWVESARSIFLKHLTEI